MDRPDSRRVLENFILTEEFGVVSNSGRQPEVWLSCWWEKKEEKKRTRKRGIEVAIYILGIIPGLFYLGLLSLVLWTLPSCKSECSRFSGGFEAFDSPSTIHTHVRRAFILRRAPPSHSLVVYYDVDYYVVETPQELDKRNNRNWPIADMHPRMWQLHFAPNPQLGKSLARLAWATARHFLLLTYILLVIIYGLIY